MIVYFVRHGLSTANTRHVLANRVSGYPLTAEGQSEVASLAQRVKSLGISVLYSSPVQRAVETASILNQELNLPLLLRDELREFDVGNLEGRSGFLAWAAFGYLWRTWFEKHRFTYRIHGGESFLDVKARFLEFINELITLYGSSDASILCVTHGGTLRIGLPYLLTGLTFKQIQSYPIHTAALIQLENASNTWHLLHWDGVTLPPQQ